MSGRQLEDELFREAQGRGSRMITCEHLEKQMRQAMHGASQWDPAIVQPAAKVNMQEAGLTYDEKPRVSPDVASLTRDLADTTVSLILYYVRQCCRSPNTPEVLNSRDS